VPPHASEAYIKHGGNGAALFALLPARRLGAAVQQSTVHKRNMGHRFIAGEGAHTALLSRHHSHKKRMVDR
jgi:hypothetical protein